MEEQESHAMRALIVDDDETCCRLLAKVLRRQGREVEWATECGVREGGAQPMHPGDAPAESLIWLPHTERR
jgi:ActR/RegA family two-component response regulator